MVEQQKEDNLVYGTVEEALPDTLFRVMLDDGTLVLAYLAGKMRKFRIRVLVGDKVAMSIVDMRSFTIRSMRASPMRNLF